MTGRLHQDPEIRELLVQCMGSTRVFAKTFFPEEVQSDFSVLHDQIFGVIDGPGRRKAIAAPRGLGKTTLAKIRVCKAILFREVPFVIYLSNSASSAEMITESIKRMLLTAPAVREIFGNIKVAPEELADTFSKKAWCAFGEMFVLPRGAGQQVRGLNWMGKRPGLVVIDDLETVEAVQSDEQRDKLRKWFFADLMKTESMYGQRAEFLYIDTIKHENALLQNLLDAEDWDGVRLSICNEELESYDPAYMTTAEIRQEYAEHQANGETDLFYMERMNIPISLKDAVFKEEYFRYFTEGATGVEIVQHVNGEDVPVRLAYRDLITFVIVDPARTVKLHSAESAVVVVSVSRNSRVILVRDVFSKKVRPDELYEAITQHCLMYDARILAVEVTGLHDYVSQPLQNYLVQKGVFVNYLELNARGDKDLRISSLAPWYRMGQILHHRDRCRRLEHQLKWHPKSKLKDIMDALSYLPIILEEHRIYFDPEEDEMPPGAEGEFDEFAVLEMEDGAAVRDENWRLM